MSNVMDPLFIVYMSLAPALSAGIAHYFTLRTQLAVDVAVLKVDVKTLSQSLDANNATLLRLENHLGETLALCKETQKQMDAEMAPVEAPHVPMVAEPAPQEAPAEGWTPSKMAAKANIHKKGRAGLLALIPQLMKEAKAPVAATAAWSIMTPAKKWQNLQEFAKGDGWGNGVISGALKLAKIDPDEVREGMMAMYGDILDPDSDDSGPDDNTE